MFVPQVGTIQPIAEIAAAIARYRSAGGPHQILFHTDAAQSLGKVQVDVR